MKTNRSAAKRFSFTGTGKVKRKRAGLRHFMRRRSKRSKRILRSRAYADASNVKSIKLLIPNG